MFFRAKRSKKISALLAPFKKMEVVDLDSYLEVILSVMSNEAVEQVNTSLLIAEIKRKILLDALKKNNFVLSDTAKFLNLLRTTLMQMLQSHNINICLLRRAQRGNPSRCSRRDIRKRIYPVV